MKENILPNVTKPEHRLNKHELFCTTDPNQLTSYKPYKILDLGME
jgi:hypothetical protein